MPASVANQLLTSTIVTNEALRVLENSLTITRHVNRQYEPMFAVDGAKAGTTINIRKPPKYLGRTGQALSLEASVETQVPFVIDQQYGVDIQFSSADLALSIDNFSDRFLKPAIANIANRIDAYVAGLYKKIANIQGTPGTVPTALLTYLLAGVDLDNNACPQDEMRGMFITPLMQAYIVDALKGLFQQSAAIAEQYVKGRMGTAAGFDWFMDQNCPTHTVGTYSGTPLVNGANQTGSTLVSDGWGSGVTSLNEGDVFTVADVYSVNPQSRQSTGQLAKFVVTSDIDDTAGAISIPIALYDGNGIIGPGSAFQNVSALPADNAAITMVGASATVSPQGLALHRDCITFASIDLPLPRGVDFAGRASDPQLGISLRIARAWDVNTDNFPCRIEVLFGADVVREELGARVAA